MLISEQGEMILQVPLGVSQLLLWPGSRQRAALYHSQPPVGVRLRHRHAPRFHHVSLTTIDRSPSAGRSLCRLSIARHKEEWCQERRDEHKYPPTPWNKHTNKASPVDYESLSVLVCSRPRLTLSSIHGPGTSAQRLKCKLRSSVNPTLKYAGNIQVSLLSEPHARDWLYV